VIGIIIGILPARVEGVGIVMCFLDEVFGVASFLLAGDALTVTVAGQERALHASVLLLALAKFYPIA